MSQKYRSNGKLMLTGEYLALQGATTFAVPLIFGQELEIEEVAHPLVYWRTLFKDKIIFHAIFETDQFNVLETSDTEKSDWIRSVFLAIRDQKDDFLKDSGAEATAKIDLPMNYGWGSSSSFITNLCKWADVNPFWVNMKVGGGSGYDIACANANKPILYHNEINMPKFHEVDYNPDFLHNMWFIFQENKMNTADAIRGFRSKQIKDSVVNRVSEISKKWIDAASIEEVMEMMREHETIISECVSMDSIADEYKDFNGEVKSLGAWGGDFMLAVSSMSGADVISYFEGKGRPTMFNWKEIVKNETE
jgi:mevalonate kinase